MRADYNKGMIHISGNCKDVQAVAAVMVKELDYVYGSTEDGRGEYVETLCPPVGTIISEMRADYRHARSALNVQAL